MSDKKKQDETPEDATEETAEEVAQDTSDLADTPEAEPKSETDDNAGTDADQNFAADDDEEPSDAETTVDDAADEPPDLTEPAQDPVESIAPQPAPAAPPRRSVVPMVLAGVITAGIGFGAAYMLPQYLPQAEDSAADIAALEQSLQEQAARITSLENAPAPEVDTSALETKVSELEDALDMLGADMRAGADRTREQVEEFEALLAEMNRMIMDRSVASDQTVTAFRDQVAAMRAELQAVSEQLQTQADSAAARAAAAQAQSVISRLSTALDSGAPFPDIVTELQVLHQVEVPDGLRAVAPTGSPTLEALQDSFPAAARAAIAASVQQDVRTGEISRFEGFMRGQFGARSLEPREGSDTDAILSRAEAALKGDNLAACLDELAALPDVAAAAIQDWTERAQTRYGALQALNILNAALAGE